MELRLDPHREELSGLQTIHAARSTEQLRDVPIIVCSADLGALARAWPDFMERGDIHRLEMPFDVDTLGSVISAALAGLQLTETAFDGRTLADERELESSQGA